MTFADENPPQSPFRRPGWIAAAVVVVLLVVVGVIVWVVSAVAPPEDAGATPEPSPSASSAPAPVPSDEGTVGGSSVCGLTAVEMSGSLDHAPATTWEYAGTTPLPVSDSFGPASSTDTGIKVCFARTPEGAALAASVGVGYLLNADTVRPWQEYALARGPIRDQILADTTPESTDAGSEIRSEVTAFRLLSYDGDTARVDVGVTVTGQGRSGYMSLVLPLVWEDGDWRVDYSESDLTAQPAQLPNLAGYIFWGK